MLRNLKRLKSLDLSSTNVVDLEPISKLYQLRSFWCAYTKVSTIRHLQALRRLSHLDCSETEVSSSELEAFRKMRPNMTIN